MDYYVEGGQHIARATDVCVRCHQDFCCLLSH